MDPRLTDRAAAAAAAQQPAPQQHPMLVPMAPLPLAIQIVAAQQHRVVQIAMHTPAGINFYFLDPDTADKVAADLATNAAAARTGLTLPTN